MNKSIAEVTTAVAGGAGVGSSMSMELLVMYRETESCSMDPMTGAWSFIGVRIINYTGPKHQTTQ